jgi:16S rRNA (uracil1498-N3)-methyltransferase
VLRLRPGDEVVVLDGSGTEYRVRLDRVLRDAAEGEVIEARQGRGEPSRRFVLYQALLPRESFEWALQKGTELGVARFVPLHTARALPGRDSAAPEKLERWRRIVREAAEQSGRARIPEVSAVLGMREGAEEAVGQGATLLAWERERARGVAEALGSLPPSRPVSLLVGPEGGFAEDEIELARAIGVCTISLGPRILRAETAGPVLAALVAYASGDLEPRG